MDKIEIIGAREHNLKGIDISIPRGKLVVITGLSGSGKSSLAFDTLYAEGQRRYMETLSPYARRFIGILERPAIESITGLTPVIAIEQRTAGGNPRSTVGTITEIYDFLRLLYARAYRAYSPVTGEQMEKFSPEQIIQLIIREYTGVPLLLLAPLVVGRKGHYKDLFENLLRKGYTQVRIDGKMSELADVAPLDRYKAHFIELVVDRIIPSEQEYKRVRDSVNVALERGNGTIAIVTQKEPDTLRFLSKHLMDKSGYSLPAPAPFTFSFNSPQGACPHCKGLGYVTQVNMESIIPDQTKSINGGGILPLGKYKDSDTFRILESMAKKFGVTLNQPIKDLPRDFLDMVVWGTEELFRVRLADGTMLASFPGVMSKFTESSDEDTPSLHKSSPHSREQYIEKTECPECHGTRLKKEALCFTIGGLNIAEVAAMEIKQLYGWIKELPDRLDKREKAIARDIIKELLERVSFLKDIGLDYITIDRATSTLSGGESQRIRLATQIGSKLVNVLYILDEPSIGLHQRDNIKLINSLKELRDKGNSVIVVEHDAETIRSADWIVDLGPGAGERGGELLYSGTPQELFSMSAKKVKSLNSLTAEYLRGERTIEVPKRRRGNGLFLRLYGATGNNLKRVNLTIPLGCFVGVSGVSGSGKSSLINETLYPILSRYFYKSSIKPLPYEKIEGVKNIDKIVVVDQSPIGRSPRSNPATYTGVFTEIRKLFEQTQDAQIRGFKQGRFSFNISGGRCEFCKGAGVQTIEMNYLPSVYVTCKECGGKRYNAETLEVKYKGKSIYDVLEMTIAEAIEFFKENPYILPKLQALGSIGLGYVKLGQQATTLSGGESQRVKLATELARRDTGRTLFILDEPTTGLHFDDIKILIGVLQQLVERGNTVIVIEHNLEILKSVDYIVDMGPGGGDRGGRIVAEGTPEEVSTQRGSYTGKYLKEILK